MRVADDLVERQFSPAAPNVLWIADVTYLRTWKGRLYLAAVQDAYSRRIINNKLSSPYPCSSKPVLRGPLGPKQYVSLAFGQAARDAGIARSMGSKGDCFDNAVAERLARRIRAVKTRRRPGNQAGWCRHIPCALNAS